MQIAIFELGASSLAPAANGAYIVLWAPTRPIALREIGVANSSATTILDQLGLVRVSARGTQTTTVTPTAAANAQGFPGVVIAPTAVIDTAWSVQPTFAANPMRLTAVAGTVGSGLIWNWQTDGELAVANGAGIGVQNLSGTGTAITRFYVVWSE